MRKDDILKRRKKVNEYREEQEIKRKEESDYVALYEEELENAKKLAEEDERDFVQEEWEVEFIGKNKEKPEVPVDIEYDVDNDFDLELGE